MEFSWPIFAAMLLLGAVQLAVGVVLGRSLPVGGRNKRLLHRKQRAEMAIDPRRLQFFASRLQKLVAGVSGEVGDHRNQISEVSRELATAREDDSGALTDSVLRSIARIVAINERLQNRLDSAEERLQQQNEQITEHFTESRTDPLTGLMNRRAFDDALSFQVEQGSRPFALMMIDVDHFKDLNDKHGHPAGDHVLCNISSRLEAVLVGRGMVARYGGEEFAVIVPAVDSVATRQIAERLRSAVAAAPFSYEDTSLALSVSLGATLVLQGDNAMAAVKRSDEALYAAKGSGRNRAYFHDGKRCRRIEHGSESSTPQATPGDSGATPAIPAGKPAPGSIPADDNFEDISADLHQRMMKVAGNNRESPAL